jgi:hypothetical protein
MEVIGLMKRRKVKREKADKRVGSEILVEQGYGALYIRTRWMEKLTRYGKKKRKEPKYLRKRHYS